MNVFGLEIFGVVIGFQEVVFLLLGGIAVGSSLMMIIQRNAIYSALFLVVAFFQFGAIYIMLGAEFLAALQVLVYTGAIMVLFLFVIMLLQLSEGPQLRDLHGFQAVAAWPLGLLLTAELVAIILTSKVSEQVANVAVKGSYSPSEVAKYRGGNVEVIGRVLYGDFLYPFEVASLILLVAVVGAVILSRKFGTDDLVAKGGIGINVGGTSRLLDPTPEERTERARQDGY